MESQKIESSGADNTNDEMPTLSQEMKFLGEMSTEIMEGNESKIEILAKDAKVPPVKTNKQLIGSSAKIDPSTKNQITSDGSNADFLEGGHSMVPPGSKNSQLIGSNEEIPYKNRHNISTQTDSNDNRLSSVVDDVEIFSFLFCLSFVK